MKDDEIVHFIIIFFSLGIVFQVYFPGVFQMALIAVSVVGAFYFLAGVVSRVLSGVFGHEVVWAKDWWHGLAILVLVALIFNRMDLAINGVVFILRLAGSVISLFAAI